MISLTAENALRAVVYLAEHPGSPHTVEHIAQCTGIRAGSLAKVLQHLCRAGLVNSQRGLHGGFILTKSPETLTFMDVILATDIPRASGRLNAVPRDALCRRLDDSRAQIEASYRSTTISQFVREQESTVAAPTI